MNILIVRIRSKHKTMECIFTIKFGKILYK